MVQHENMAKVVMINLINTKNMALKQQEVMKKNLIQFYDDRIKIMEKLESFEKQHALRVVSDDVYMRSKEQSLSNLIKLDLEILRNERSKDKLKEYVNRLDLLQMMVKCNENGYVELGNIRYGEQSVKRALKINLVNEYINKLKYDRKYLQTFLSYGIKDISVFGDIEKGVNIYDIGKQIEYMEKLKKDGLENINIDQMEINELLDVDINNIFNKISSQEIKR